MFHVAVPSDERMIVPDAIELLKARRSIKPREMTAPGPSPAELDTILTIGAPFSAGRGEGQRGAPAGSGPLPSQCKSAIEELAFDAAVSSDPGSPRRATNMQGCR